MAAGQGRESTSASEAEPLSYDRVLAAAAKLFADKGYAATTTRELATELGIQRASLYYHVGDKEELLYEVCRRALEHGHHAFDEEVAPVAPPLDRLTRFIHVHVSLLLDRRDDMMTLLLEMRSLTGTRLASVLDLRDAYEARLMETISAAQREGGLRADHDARTLALSLMNMLNWTIVWYRRTGRFNAEDLAASYQDLFFNGAVPRGRRSRSAR